MSRNNVNFEYLMQSNVNCMNLTLDKQEIMFWYKYGTNKKIFIIS